MTIAPIYFQGNTGRQDRSLLIFVEGTDDAYFLDAILQDVGANPDSVGIIIVGGKSNFPSAISMHKKSPFYKKSRGIAVIRDADDNLNLAITDTNTVFLKEFESETAHAQVNFTDRFRLGLFVFPGDGANGDLEKLCLSTVAGTDLDQSAQAYMDDILKNGNLTQVEKRKVQVFLAAIPTDICRGAGMGFKKGFFNISHDSLNPIKAFLRQFIAEDSLRNLAA